MFSISSWLRLEDLCFSFMLFILLEYSCSQQSLMILCISVFFITDFIDLGTLSFFSMSLAQGLSVLFIFSKNQLLSFIDIFHCFFSLYFIYFCSDLCNFLLSTNFMFCLFIFIWFLQEFFFQSALADLYFLLPSFFRVPLSIFRIKINSVTGKVKHNLETVFFFFKECYIFVQISSSCFLLWEIIQGFFICKIGRLLPGMYGVWWIIYEVVINIQFLMAKS